MTNELKAALKLSDAEKILLVEKIWDSIEPENIPLTKAQKKELDRRLARMKRGETKFYSWEEVKQRLHSLK